jgi:hypothetical protein
MTAAKGVNYTLQTNTPVDLLLPIDSHGRVRVLYDTYEAAALASGSTIGLFTIPKGARVVDFAVWCDALGASSTLAMGDTSDADRLMVATSSASAVIIKPVIADINKFAGYKYTADSVISITTAGASITGTIHVYLFYVLD